MRQELGARAAAAEPVARRGPLHVERRAPDELPAHDTAERQPKVVTGDVGRRKSIRPQGHDPSRGIPLDDAEAAEPGAAQASGTQRALEVGGAHVAGPRRLLLMGIVAIRLRWYRASLSPNKLPISACNAMLRSLRLRASAKSPLRRAKMPSRSSRAAIALLLPISCARVRPARKWASACLSWPCRWASSPRSRSR